MANNNEKDKKILELIEDYSANIHNIPTELIEQLKNRYLSDPRDYKEIEQEINRTYEFVSGLEELVNKDIDENILEKSIILIGPIGSGKSTIGNKLREQCNMPQISLDNRKVLANLYEQRDRFNHFKEFEFFLTSTVLTNLQEPTIIDFGAGHSIYENQAMYLEMKSLLQRFSNVVLLMPSEDKEESLNIINERLNINSSSRQYNDNKHFIDMPCNYELSTITIYTKDKTIEETTQEIINHINQKSSNIGGVK